MRKANNGTIDRSAPASASKPLQLAKRPGVQVAVVSGLLISLGFTGVILSKGCTARQDPQTAPPGSGASTASGPAIGNPQYSLGTPASEVDAVRFGDGTRGDPLPPPTSRPTTSAAPSKTVSASDRGIAGDGKPAPSAKPSSTSSGTGAGYAGGSPADPAGSGNLPRRSGLRLSPVQLPAIPGALPSPEEEVWVIKKFKPTHPGPQRDDLPGVGTLICRAPNPSGIQQVVTIPLQSTDVSASITGFIASVDVKQVFTNPYPGKIEAVYVFPLPENAAVTDFIMTIGDRRIRGLIRDAEEAKVIYNEAKSQGYTAALLEQDRPNIFTQRVANIEPGKRIDINISYFNTLQSVDGRFEFVFPTVVGPRFNPAGFYDGVGAAPAGPSVTGQAGATGQRTEQQYLTGQQTTAHRINITATIEPGTGSIEPVIDVSSLSHAINKQSRAGKTVITLSQTDTLPNKDFVLRWKLPGTGTRSSTSAAVGPDGAVYFTSLFVPPDQLSELNRAPLEIVLVVDCSGSMSGRPIEQAIAAGQRVLRRLQPSDTFQVINFARTASALGPAPLPATPANIERGSAYLGGLFAEGGTMMLNGLRASLNFPHTPERERYVVFLTDAYIGNESEILTELHANLGSTRVFSFGVGTSTNRYLLDAMAKVGRGCVAHVAAGDNPVEVMDSFIDRISRPALTDLAITINGQSPESCGAEIFPRQLPDVFVGRPVTISGRIPADRWQGMTRGDLVPGAELIVEASGKARSATGEGIRQAVRTSAAAVLGNPSAPMGAPSATSGSAKALASIWARRKIADMADYAGGMDARAFASQVKTTALTYNLMSPYTSFLAVDTLAPTPPGIGTTVQVPVPMPDGVKYETTVPSR